MILGRDTMEGLQPDSREERQASELMSQGLISQRCCGGFCKWRECHTLNSSGPQGGPAAVKWSIMTGFQEPKARRKEHGHLFPSSPFGSSIPFSLIHLCRQSLTGSQLSYRALVCGSPSHRAQSQIQNTGGGTETSAQCLAQDGTRPRCAKAAFDHLNNPLLTHNPVVL